LFTTDNSSDFARISDVGLAIAPYLRARRPGAARLPFRKGRDSIEGTSTKGEGMPLISDSKYSQVHLGVEAEAEPVELDPEKPFRILLAGDFSGRAWRKNPPGAFTPQLIDRDNLDEVLAGMKVSLHLHGITLSFAELEDFHPDRICQATPLFENLDELLEQPEPPKPVPPPAAPRPPSASSLLDRMLAEQDAPEPEAGVSLEDADDLPSFIRRATKGYLEPRPDPAQQQRATKREALATEILQGLLHHPHMQAIEAAWRALFLLIRGLNTGSNLKLYVLDVTLPELVAEMDAIQKELRRKGPWAVLVGNYTFGQSELDTQVLRRLAGLASSLGAPFVAEAQLPGEGPTEQAWRDLRHSPEARWIGLALPRFLLRLPYGKATGSIESFPFEEMPESQHAAYLWGNPAFFCAYLLGKSFLARGWQLGPLERRIDGLPMHVYREDGEPVAKPCAEVLMTERDALSLLDAGFMPLASLKHEPAALIVRFQSIAQPLAPLAGLP
jgi:type VI secretion system protein ImpC